MIGQKMLSGTLWSAVDRLSMQFTRFAIGIVLGRLLGPEVYTTIGILLVFLSISRVFIESGFPAALIQKISRTERDISTVFVFNLCISIICYALLFCAAPFIADYYARPELNLLLKVLAFNLIINSLIVIPSTLLTIDLNFKSVARINFFATFLAGLVAIWMAFNEFGVWTLVWQNIIRSSITLLLFWIGTKWKLSFHFSLSSFKGLFKVGGNILISSLLNRSVNDASSLILGKYFTEDALGLYSQGSKFSLFVSGSASAILNRVLLPSLAGIQGDLVQLKDKFRKVLSLTSLIATPIFFLMLVAADPLIRYLLKEQWIEAVPILQIFCIARLITIYCSLNLNILTVIGRTDLLLRQQYVAIAVRIIAVGLFIPFGIVYLALGELISTVIHLYINSYFTGKTLNYRFFDQIKDLTPSILVGGIVSLICVPILYLEISDISKIVFIAAGGGTAYLLLSYLFQRNDLTLLFSTLKRVSKGK